METLEMRDFPRMTVKKPAAPRVLIVDDEALIRWSVSETLTERGYEVVETGDANGARLAVGDDQPFDVACSITGCRTPTICRCWRRSARRRRRRR